MKSTIEIEYVESIRGGYVGWAKDYTGVVAEAETKKQLKEEILKSLKVLMLHYIDEIDNGNVQTKAFNVTDIV